MKNAEEIYFIGYSFPKTDVNNLEFLLRHRDRFKKAVVLDSVGRQNLMRLQKLLGEDLVESCDAKEFIKNL